MSNRYLVRCWYLGNFFHGSQRQPNLITVEQVLLDTLLELNYIDSIEEARIQAGQRTDSGVSARDALFSFTTKKKLYVSHLNSKLPDSIGITNWIEVPDNFNPRKEIIEKEYRYYWPLSYKTSNEHFFTNIYWEDHNSAKIREIDIDIMRDVMKLFEGTYNFSFFMKKDSSRPYLDTKLTISKTKLILNKNNILEFHFRGKRFLWEQIRRLVQTSIEVGLGNVEISEIKNILNGKKKSSLQKIGPAPAMGLILWRTKLKQEYEKNFSKLNLKDKRKNNKIGKKSIEIEENEKKNIELKKEKNGKIKEIRHKKRERLEDRKSKKEIEIDKYKFYKRTFKIIGKKLMENKVREMLFKQLLDFDLDP